ncbi:MAG: TetR/AcrR family transcriptional regulator, partial [Bacteroidales bacterium]|nr:TetR/AcrR family transcriptional regulator [Bacteroidales bacterium]
MKKDKYLDKAITLFKKEGVSMPIEVIAEKMGVSKKTLYNNFESKDGLIEQCMESV